jgi:Lon protease-like protein
MDDLERIRRALPQLPIFPLPGAVLLPHALVPLHIFEPRYRKMTRDCYEGLKVLALANIPDEEAAGENPPRVEKVIGVGILSRVEPLPDGRFYIVLRGVVRARIDEELKSGEPYRLVRAHELRSYEQPKDEQLAAGLRRLVLALCAKKPMPESEALAEAAGRARDPGSLADLVASALLEQPEERQQILEAEEVSERLRLVTQAAAAALAKSSPSPSVLN